MIRAIVAGIGAACFHICASVRAAGPGMPSPRSEHGTQRNDHDEGTNKTDQQHPNPPLTFST